MEGSPDQLLGPTTISSQHSLGGRPSGATFRKTTHGQASHRNQCPTDPPHSNPSRQFWTPHQRTYQCARIHLRKVEAEDEKTVEEILEEHSIEDVLREYQITPPAITTTVARNVMKRLCDAAEIDIPTPPDGPGYLQLHGARRGIGDTFY